ncbi:MAG: 5-dehydro-2-deoxygluconokinase [Acidobacteria bacterium]|nr:5-dehydro-2-deoxygluconokinase [Acidobacteriota bacterium]TDI50429.1 MAG: 5-dehydro-2-deoxygluconokinase [Acidobacteriota bacterium]
MKDNSFEVLTIGRVSVDLFPPKFGLSLSEIESFDKFLGGSPTNVAVAASRYGHRSAVITRVGDDGFGEYVRIALRGFGVDERYVGTDPVLRTPVVFAEIHPPDRFPLLFYREPRGPDMRIVLEDLDLEAIRSADIFWTTGTGLSHEPSRSATLAALEERGRRQHTIHDLDYRASFWSSPEDAGKYQRFALNLVSVAVGNQEECAVAVGPGSPEDQAARLLDLGLELAIVKMGPAGVLIAWSDGTERVGPLEIDVVNGLGAGDAFGGALCHGLLLGWGPVEILHFANAAGAYVAARLACADAMPTEQQVRELISDVA